MKTLFLMRHASAGNGSDDHDRALTPGGVREAQRVAEHLAAHDIPPTGLLCSSARRTLETLEQLEKHLPERTQNRTLRELYLASPGEILRCVAEADDEHAQLLVLGHLPGVAELANMLIRSGDDEARSRVTRGFAPAAVAVLRLDVVAWSETRGNVGELLEFTSPSDLD